MNETFTDIHILSVIALTMGLVTFALILASDKNQFEEDFLVLNTSDRWTAFFSLMSNPINFAKTYNSNGNYKIEIFVIIILLLFCNLLNMVFTLNTVDYSTINGEYEANVGILMKQFYSVNIFMSQVGGLFFQSVIVYTLGVFLDSQIKFEEYLKCIGLSYVGFFLSALILFVYNILSLDHFTDLSDLTTTMSTSFPRITIGKLGEYWSLAILSLLIYKCSKGKMNIFWSIFNAYFPSITILLSSIVFNQLFSK